VQRIQNLTTSRSFLGWHLEDYRVELWNLRYDNRARQTFYLLKYRWKTNENKTVLLRSRKLVQRLSLDCAVFRTAIEASDFPTWVPF
jgi:transposase